MTPYPYYSIFSNVPFFKICVMVALECRLDLNSQHFSVISQIITHHALQKHITVVYCQNLL